MSFGDFPLRRNLLWAAFGLPWPHVCLPWSRTQTTRHTPKANSDSQSIKQWCTFSEEFGVKHRPHIAKQRKSSVAISIFFMQFLFAQSVGPQIFYCSEQFYFGSYQIFAHNRSPLGEELCSSHLCVLSGGFCPQAHYLRLTTSLPWLQLSRLCPSPGIRPLADFPRESLSKWAYLVRHIAMSNTTGVC